MASPTIDRKMQVFTQSNAVDALGKAIGEIKHEDGLTWADVGRVLGVSDDQAAKYASGFATMSAFTLACGKREWGGRFTGYFDRLVLGSRPGTVNGQTAINHILSAVSVANMAMRDGEITPRDAKEHRSTFEVARDQLDELLRLAGEA